MKKKIMTGAAVVLVVWVSLKMLLAFVPNRYPESLVWIERNTWALQLLPVIAALLILLWWLRKRWARGSHAGGHSHEKTRWTIMKVAGLLLMVATIVLIGFVCYTLFDHNILVNEEIERIRLGIETRANALPGTTAQVRTSELLPGFPKDITVGPGTNWSQVVPLQTIGARNYEWRNLSPPRKLYLDTGFEQVLVHADDTGSGRPSKILRWRLPPEECLVQHATIIRCWAWK